MEKAPIDTSDVEEKAEEIISEAEPPSEVYLSWVFLVKTRRFVTLWVLLGLCEACAYGNLFSETLYFVRKKHLRYETR